MIQIFMAASSGSHSVVFIMNKFLESTTYEHLHKILVGDFDLAGSDEKATIPSVPNP